MKVTRMCRPFHLLALVFGFFLLGGCGASIQAVYEGDVRFEHCMALDWRKDVRVSIRQRCWIEWVQHYTYGQTRDRVLHAKKRIVVLGKSDFLDGSPQSKVFEGRFVGERQRSGALGPNACHGDCRVERDFCSRTCGDDLCKRNCAYGFASCVRVCG